MGLIWYAAAAVWGMAEATLFFIVPDVLLTFAVVRFGLRRGLVLAVVAAGFASFAGLGMWAWGYSDPASARHALLLVPAIGPDLLARAAHEVGRGWPLHLVTGAMTGVPYKLYAVEAGARGINPALFVPMSFVARVARFALTAVLMAAGRWLLLAINWPRLVYPAWGLAWLATYTFYFYITTRTLG